MKIIILGSGASPGVPIIGCSCKICTSDNPKNKRSRVSIYIEHEGTRILIDTSPDMRQQFITNKISSIDAIIYTHAHADHTHGIDDVRSFNYQNAAPIPAYMDSQTEQGIKSRFAYAFMEPIPAFGWFRPCLQPVEIKTNTYQDFTVGSLTITPFEQIHGKSKTIGIRIGDFAYSTDVNGLPQESLEALKGVKIWIVDCLQYDPAPTHAHLDMALGWIDIVRPERAILTHMSHVLDYDELALKLPKAVEPAFDGMVIDLNPLSLQ
jgi:phosphoribosyl 1,2-cyclic phosphate phosphodiesterase